jgi:hypothetical protein
MECWDFGGVILLFWRRICELKIKLCSDRSLCEQLEEVFDVFPGFITKILLSDFNAIIWVKTFWNLQLHNDSLRESIGDNVVRRVNFAT